MARPIATPPTKRGQDILDFLVSKGLSLAEAARLARVDKGTLSRAVHDGAELHAESVASLIAPPLEMPIALASPALAEALRTLEKRARRTSR